MANRTNFASGSPPFLAHGTGQPPPAQPIPRPPGVLGMNTGAALAAAPGAARRALEDLARPREDSPGLSVARLSEGASPIGDQVRTAVGQAGDRGRAWVEELANDPDADEETREMRRQLLGMPALPSRAR